MKKRNGQFATMTKESLRRGWGVGGWGVGGGGWGGGGLRQPLRLIDSQLT